MNKYNVQIILSPVETDLGRGSRRFDKEFDATSKEEAEDFGKQYFEGFLREGVEIITYATIIIGRVRYN
jgi:hypothetical protein